MTDIVQTGVEPSSAAPEGDQPSTDFETAQRDLFRSVGLDVRSRFVDLESPRVRTHLFEAGAVGEGVPLLFVHGGAAFGAFLSPLMAELDDAWLVGLDRPGYGTSGGFDYTEGNLRRTAVDVLDGVLDVLGVDRVDLVGHSMGGYASIRYALARPDRVRRLIVVGAAAAVPGTRPPLVLRLLTVPGVSQLLQRMQKPGVEGILDVAEVFGERETVQDYPELVRAMVAHEADPKCAEAGLGEFAAFFSLRGWHPSVRLSAADLGEIRQPTLVVWGEHDPIGSPDDVRAGIEAIPDVRFETMPTAHAPFLAEPERCGRLVREFRGA